MELNEAIQANQTLLEETAKKNALVRRWSPILGKFDELKGASREKLGLMAALLENQKKAGAASSSILTEDATTTSNIADFTRFALPLIRKSYPRLILTTLLAFSQ